MFAYDFKLNDKNGREIKLGDIVRFSNEPDMYYDEEASTFIGEVVFECGAFGIRTDEDIPDFISDCSTDNFVSFWELYINLNYLAKFSDISDYLEILVNEDPKVAPNQCEECFYKSKCEYRGNPSGCY